MLIQMSLVQAQELLQLSLSKCNELEQSIMEELCKSPCSLNQANKQTSASFYEGQTQPAVRRKIWKHKFLAKEPGSTSLTTSAQKYKY